MDLRELMEVASASEAVDYATARRSLPIAYLLESHNFKVLVDSDKLRSICPFHEDTNPSLTVFGNNLERWGCWSCGAKGDAVDMLARFEPELVRVEEDGTVKHTAALYSRVRELITEVVNEGWAGPSAGSIERKPFDVKDAQEIVEQSQLAPNLARIEEYIQFKREQRGVDAWPFTADYLVEEWGVGTWGTWVIIPYYKEDGTLLSYKRWTSPERKRFTHGQGIWAGHMYGEHIADDGKRDVIIVEGESDEWYTHFKVGDQYRVLGVPLGAHTAPVVKGLKGRSVLLGFDGDDAGIKANRLWAEALEEEGANVRILPIPSGMDISTAGDINALIMQAQPLVKPPQGITATPTGYARSRGGSLESISNWVFVPIRALRGDNSLAFEGTLKPGGETAVIRTTDMASDAKLVAWAGRYGRAWMGSSNDARKLLAMLQADAVFIPTGYLVSVAGLHGDTFVWPGGQIGPAPVVYVPPSADGHLEDKLHIRHGQWSTSLIHKLRDLQAHDVTDPFLAWMAAAPLKTLMPGFKFPFIGVSGDFGAGKTETTRMMIQVFSGSQIEQTFTSTPHALRSAFAASNAMIVLAGERRKGAREATIEAGDQLLRQAWNMQVSQQGGMGGASWAELTDIVPSAPIVIEGEDMFSEGSHIERMVPLHLQEEGKNEPMFTHLLETAFDRRTGVPITGLPHAYLTWLQTNLTQGVFDDLDIEPKGPKELADRQRYTLGVLHLGWGLLQAFMSEYNDGLDAPNFTTVQQKYLDMNKRTPVEEALMWCLGQADARPFIFIRDGEVWVDVPLMFSFLSDPRRAMLFTLPGKVPFLKSHLESKFGADTRVKDFREFSVFPISRIAR